MFTVIVLVLFADIVFEQLPLSNFVIVINEFPAVVNPVASNDPVPADVTSIVAVSPVAAGVPLL